LASNQFRWRQRKPRQPLQNGRRTRAQRSGFSAGRGVALARYRFADGGDILSRGFSGRPCFRRCRQGGNRETVVCIIEAMKVMNEIKAETKGVIAESSPKMGSRLQFASAVSRAVMQRVYCRVGLSPANDLT